MGDGKPVFRLTDRERATILADYIGMDVEIVVAGVHRLAEDDGTDQTVKGRLVAVAQPGLGTVGSLAIVDCVGRLDPLDVWAISTARIRWVWPLHAVGATR